MFRRKKKPTKSSNYKNSTPNSSSKSDKYDEQKISLNATESINSEWFPGSPNTQSSSYLTPTSLIQPQTDKFVNIAPFPIFKGTDEECPFTHLSRFLKVCRANNISLIQSLTRIFPITLENEAALWFDLNIEPYPSLSWEEIKSSFLEAFQKINFESEIRAMKRGNNESVRSYFLRLQWLLKIHPDHGLAEEVIIGVFINGLKGGIKELIESKKPDSLDYALRLAFEWEKERGVRKSCDICEISGKMRGLGLKREDEVREMKKNQCQCSKHQCGKKRFERNNSIFSVTSNCLLP